jgi:hypothetical protein
VTGCLGIRFQRFFIGRFIIFKGRFEIPDSLIQKAKVVRGLRRIGESGSVELEERSRILIFYPFFARPWSTIPFTSFMSVGT